MVVAIEGVDLKLVGSADELVPRNIRDRIPLVHAAPHTHRVTQALRPKERRSGYRAARIANECVFFAGRFEKRSHGVCQAAVVRSVKRVRDALECNLRRAG